PPPFARGRYPDFTMADNVRVQQRLLSEVFGIERVKLVYGFSMGAQQAFHWGALFPDRVERIAPICGSAKTSPHNYVFLEGVKTALTADPAWQDGWFATQPIRGFQAMGRVYAGWGLSQGFYREEVWRRIGFSSLAVPRCTCFTGCSSRYVRLRSPRRRSPAPRPRAAG